MKKLLLLVSLVLVSGCSKPSEKLVVGGSTSVLGLMEELASNYEDLPVEVQGGGSSVGVQGVVNGTFDLGMASRELKASETEVVGTPIAYDGIVVITHPDNPLQDLSLDQVKAIFTGKITNWQELGGADSEIAVIAREEGSGTRGAFEEIVDFDSSELVSNSQIQKTTGGVIQGISNNKQAIGYISLGSVSELIKPLSINGVEASAANIKNDSYALYRPFLIVTNNEATSKHEAYIDYLLSDEAQVIVSANGFVSIEK